MVTTHVYDYLFQCTRILLKIHLKNIYVLEFNVLVWTLLCFLYAHRCCTIRCMLGVFPSPWSDTLSYLYNLLWLEMQELHKSISVQTYRKDCCYIRPCSHLFRLPFRSRSSPVPLVRVAFTPGKIDWNGSGFGPVTRSHLFRNATGTSSPINTPHPTPHPSTPGY